MIVCDTGPLVAAAINDGAHHRACVDLFTAVELTGDDYRRAAELVLDYDSLPLGTTDATVPVICERLGVTELATLDRRHFTVVRPRHVDALTLLPE